jgi:hypothetical protein
MLVARYWALFPLKTRPVGQVARSRTIKCAIRSSLRTFTFDSEGSVGTASVVPLPRTRRAESLPPYSLPTCSAAGARL